MDFIRKRFRFEIGLFGLNLGIAFQIADDVLGLWGDPALTGKSARTDLLSRKKSYPVLAAMQSTYGAELRALYAQPEWSEADIQRIESLLLAADARTEATLQAKHFAAIAQAALETTNLENDAMTRLRELLTQVVHREK